MPKGYQALLDVLDNYGEVHMPRQQEGHLWGCVEVLAHKDLCGYDLIRRTPVPGEEKEASEACDITGVGKHKRRGEGRVVWKLLYGV